MSQASEIPENQAEPFFGTEQITSSPTADGKPLAVEEMTIPSLDASAEGADDAEEKVIWEGRYSLRNFLGRILWRAALTAGFIPLAVVTWEKERQDIAFVTILIGSLLLISWAVLITRIVSAAYAKHYTLTNHRLFVTSGFFNSRKDQVELSRVSDVYTRHTLWEKWLSLGTVVLVSGSSAMPIFTLTGISDPDSVVDLILKSMKSQHAEVASGG